MATIENLFTQQLVTGEKITLRNTGTSTAGVVARKDDYGFAFRTLKAGAGIQVKQLGDDIIITNSGTLAQSFLTLTEAPTSFADANGKMLMYNSVTGKLEFGLPAPVYGTILTLTDSPDSYTGMNNRYLMVDETNNRMIFSDLVGVRIAPLEGRMTTAESALTALGLKKAVTVSATAPVSATEGDFWFDSINGALYIRYGTPGSWIEIGSSEPAAPPVESYDYGGTFEGTPSANQVIYRWRPPIGHVLKDEFVGCSFTCVGAPSSTFSCKIFVGGVHVGDWHISTSKNYTLVTLATDVVVPPHTEVKVVAPAVAVTGINGITMTFLGERQ